MKSGPGVKVNYAESELGQAAVECGEGRRCRDCGDWQRSHLRPGYGARLGKTVDGGGTLACTVPSDGREGRDRESIILAQEQLVKQIYAVESRRRW